MWLDVGPVNNSNSSSCSRIVTATTYYDRNALSEPIKVYGRFVLTNTVMQILLRHPLPTRVGGLLFLR